MMFTAAIATDNTLRDGLIAQLHGYASPNKQNQPFEVVYNPVTADQISGSSRSDEFLDYDVIFFLTNETVLLREPCSLCWPISRFLSSRVWAYLLIHHFRVPIKLNPSGGTNKDGNGHGHSSHAGAIAGGVVAGVIAVAAIVAGVFLFLRRRRGDGFGNEPERIQATKRVKPPGFSSDAVLEPLGPMTQFPSAESQPTLFPQSSQHLSSVSLLHKSGQSTPFPPSPGSPPALGISPYLDDPSANNAVFEKQRLMMRAHEASGNSSSAPYAPVPSREVAPLAGGSSSPVSAQIVGPDLRLELDDLRREVERIRQERETAQEAPPMYDTVLEEGLRR